MQITCANCSAENEIADPSDDALDRRNLGDAVSVGVTVKCDECKQSVFYELRRDEIVEPPPPPRWDAQQGRYVVEGEANAQ